MTCTLLSAHSSTTSCSIYTSCSTSLRLDHQAAQLIVPTTHRSTAMQHLPKYHSEHDHQLDMRAVMLAVALQ
eukprot:9698-Heterococcus_DN1.PRE.8